MGVKDKAPACVKTSHSTKMIAIAIVRVKRDRIELGFYAPDQRGFAKTFRCARTRCIADEDLGLAGRLGGSGGVCDRNALFRSPRDAKAFVRLWTDKSAFPRQNIH